MTAPEKMTSIKIVRESMLLAKSLALMMYIDLQNRFPVLAEVEEGKTTGVAMPCFTLRDADNFRKIVAKARCKDQKKEIYIPEKLDEIMVIWTTFAPSKQNSILERTD